MNEVGTILVLTQFSFPTIMYTRSTSIAVHHQHQLFVNITFLFHPTTLL